MRTLPEYEEKAAAAHGHLCAGQILGLRMAIYGMQLLGVADPEGKDRKRLVTFVEIDRCATDAISVVTGCRLGKRALKFRDFGKVAATFCDVESGRAVRVAAKESARSAARELFPEIEGSNRQQMAAYRVLQPDQLFSHEWVRVELGPEEFPGYKGARAVCEVCGEGINFERQVVEAGRTLCRACAGASYYRAL